MGLLKEEYMNKIDPHIQQSQAHKKIKISLKNIGKQFKIKNKIITAIENIDLDIQTGEFVCIVGPSGCGKTTLLRILAQLEQPSEGTLTMVHDDLNKPLNSMVFQEHAVFPWMTVKKNIAYGLTMRKLPKDQVEAAVEHYLQKTGLKKFANSYPHQLSGGMKQRVSVARAFANDPEILLMDEPFAALDEQNRIILQQELVRIWEETRKTVVFITHSIDEAIFLADRVYVMTSHPGMIARSFSIDLPRPRKIEQVRNSPRFQELFNEIWNILRMEVNKAKQSEML
ncbi:ABC transporter ATP-binding protein [Fodinisporobacter ferrooxydans]|uniref:ABC transporter ATP-binding protein n=1 Tax=Fodinisporobacter ferrooxydans TaxID=2901836 RepID=A0ABY4CJD2_9BACL|nr:ABC transporter ATP-binding protein [Alicyclobacillaceae bacterium MYW30-H2]